MTTPIVAVPLPKPLGEMTDDELNAYAAQIADAMFAARTPAPETPPEPTP